MSQLDRARAADASRNGGGFVLYFEGPGDRGILQGWSRRLLPPLAQWLFRGSVILGGRQPARAVEHFRGLVGAGSGRRGLCVLDRDDGSGPDLPGPGEPGLEFFIWGRRHIESYLLVPGAIRRALRLPDADARVERVLRDQLPPEGDEDAYREFDAKRILGPGGALTRVLGTPIPLARIARATRASELHPDVHSFFATLRLMLGYADPTPRVYRVGGSRPR